MALYLEDKLFHAIQSYQEIFNINSNSYEERMAIKQELIYNEMLLKLDSILSTGAILSRNELNNRYPNLKITYCNVHFSGDNDTISLAKHKNAPINYKKVPEKIFQGWEHSDYYYDADYDYLIKDFKTWKSEDAYLTFVTYGVSLVFDNKLLENCIHGKYAVMAHELLFKKEIPLDLLVGLSIPIWDAPLLMPYFLEEEPDDNYFTKKEYVKYDFMRSVLELIKKYQLNIPLVALENGEEFRENNDFTRRLENRKNKV